MSYEIQPKKTIGIFVILLVAGVGWGEPIEWSTESGGNGHFYDIVAVDAPLSWFQAVALAELTGGHLATIASAAENDFIFEVLASNPAYWTQEGELHWGPWIGAFQSSGSVEPGGGWQWITDDEFEFANWMSGSPDNANGQENWLHFAAIQEISPTWNDAFSNDSRIRSYIVEFIADCNHNGLPDACDIQCGSSGSACDFEGCGAEDDCNLNGIPDECDIAGGASMDDDPMDGVPDECAWFEGGCAAVADWSCFDNWNIPGNSFPGIAGAQPVSVTLNQTDDVFLDVDAVIKTLRIEDDAVLRVTQTGSEGDLTLVESGGLLIEGGSLYINNGREIDASVGQVRVGNGGLFTLEPPRTNRSFHIELWPYFQFGFKGGEPILRPSVPTPVGLAGTVHSWLTRMVNGMQSTAPMAGTLMSADLVLQSGGTMNFSKNMTLLVRGDLQLNGQDAGPCESGGNRGVILPPPKFRAVGTAQAAVAGNVVIAGTVDVVVASANNLVLDGDMDHSGGDPGCFDWSKGGITMKGLTQQVVEVAGRDVGAMPNGFQNGSDTNFSLGRLELAGGRSVELRNEFLNTVGTGPCQEALYVHDLTLRAGSTLTLNNCRVYYERLNQESGANIEGLGCGKALQVVACARASDCEDRNPCTTDRCDLATGACVYFNNRKPCNDGLYCTKPDTCTDGICVGQERCPGQQCDETEKRCIPFEP